MEYYRLRDCHYFAVADDTVQTICTWHHAIRIEFVSSEISSVWVHKSRNELVEITRSEFYEAEKVARRMMWEAAKKFSPTKQLAA